MVSLMREILQEDYLHLTMSSYTAHEDLAQGRTNLSCVLHDHTGGRVVVEGQGVGIIDALFNALRAHWSAAHASLESIEFSSFEIQGLLSADHTTRAQARAVVGVLNSEGRAFEFDATAASVGQAGVLAVLEATEYFVNSEKTFVKLYDIVRHHKEEGRADLVQKYTSLMSRVVANTSYSAVVEQIKGELG